MVSSVTGKMKWKEWDGVAAVVLFLDLVTVVVVFSLLRLLCRCVVANLEEPVVTVTCRCKLSLINEIKKLIRNTPWEKLFRDTCFGWLLNLAIFWENSILIHFMNCCQVECLEDDTENVSLTYHLGGDMEIQFDREEFCLVTGLKFRVDYSSNYSEGRILFRRRVFNSARDGHAITAKMLEDKIKSKEFMTMNHNDAVSLCLLAVVECVLLGEEPRHNVSEWCLRLVDDRDRWNLYPWGSYVWPTLYYSLRDSNVRRWPVFYATLVEEDDDKYKYTLHGFTWAFKGARPTTRLTPDAVEDRSNCRDDPNVELYRLLEEQRRDLHAVKEKREDYEGMYNQMKKFMEDMRVGKMPQAKKGPIFVGQHYGLTTVDPRGQYGLSDIRDVRGDILNAKYQQKRVVRPSMYVQSPYMNMPDSTVPPKKLPGDNEVAITDVVQFDEYLWYTNVDPSKVRRERYEECMTFLNNPEPVYLDYYVKGFIAMQHDARFTVSKSGTASQHFRSQQFIIEMDEHIKGTLNGLTRPYPSWDDVDCVSVYADECRRESLGHGGNKVTLFVNFYPRLVA
ncbi:phospholipase-like protein [Tanacetum coccineum]